jgi:hypothetical protein
MPGSSGDEHNAPLSGLGLLPAPHQQFELLVSPEQRRGEIGPTSVKTIFHPACTGGLPHVHRVGKAFQRVPAVAQILRDHAAQAFDLPSAVRLEGANYLALLLRVEPRREAA